jgi:hypothetical protein
MTQQNGLIYRSISSIRCITSSLHPWSDLSSSRFVFASEEPKIYICLCTGLFASFEYVDETKW